MSSVVKNRFLKNTLGIFAELVIAAALDTEETTGTGATPSQATVLVTIAADPTPGDLITITVDGVPYTHTIPVGDQTTQEAHDSIAALLAGNSQGFTLPTHSGTTSSVFQLSWAGANKNGKTVTLAETGSTFTVAGPYTFAGGVDADAAAADDLEAFVADSDAGTVWAFWEDINAAGKHAALVQGDTSNPANINRKFFYAYKDSAGATKTTTAIPVRGLKYDTIPYDAGTAQISKVTYGGTVSNGQILHVKIIDTTATQVPYPNYQYEAVVAGGTADSAVAAIAAAINAETDSPIVTATAATDTLTITATSKFVTFKLAAYVEVTAAQPTDASAITFPTGGTAAAKSPTGDLASIQELEKYRNIYSGGINYAPEGTTVDEFQTAAPNSGSIAQWGILMVKSSKVEKGVVYDHTSKAYVIVAVPTGSETVLAAL